MRIADLALLNSLAQRLEIMIETAVEADLENGRRLFHGSDDLGDPLGIRVRFFAENMFSRLRGFDQHAAWVWVELQISTASISGS